MESKVSAAKYLESSSTLQEKCIQGILDRLNINEGDQVLDVGCGTGNVTAILAEKAGPRGKVLAFDRDSERIFLAKKMQTNKNIKFVNAEIFDLKVEKEHFDKVFSNFVFNWLPFDEKIRVAKEIMTNMKPGGLFGLITSADIPKNANILSVFLSEHEKKILNEMFFYETKSRFEEMFKKVGFEIVQLDRCEFEVLSRDIESYLDWCTSSVDGKLDYKSAYWKNNDKIKLEKSSNGNIIERLFTFQIILRKPN